MKYDLLDKINKYNNKYIMNTKIITMSYLRFLVEDQMDVNRTPAWYYSLINKGIISPVKIEENIRHTRCYYFDRDQALEAMRKYISSTKLGRPKKTIK